jgi:excisionase family DNA binding protein
MPDFARTYSVARPCFRCESYWFAEISGQRLTSPKNERVATRSSGRLIAANRSGPVKKLAKKSKVVRRMKATSNGEPKAGGNGGLAKAVINPLMTKPSKESGDQILTVPMLAEYLLCHPSTIYRLLKNKRIPGFRVGSDWRFRRSAIDQWLSKATIPAAR